MFSNAMVGATMETRLALAQAFQMPLGTLCAFGLQSSTQRQHLLACVFYLFAREGLAVAIRKPD
jgi:hypothetical protein